MGYFNILGYVPCLKIAGWILFFFFFFVEFALFMQRCTSSILLKNYLEKCSLVVLASEIVHIRWSSLSLFCYRSSLLTELRAHFEGEEFNLLCSVP